MQIIIDTLKERGMIDEDEIWYTPADYPFTRKDFQAYTAGIWEAADLTACRYEHSSFNSYIVPFKHGDETFYLFVMFGQGSAWTLMCEDAWKNTDTYLRELHARGE